MRISYRVFSDTGASEDLSFLDRLKERGIYPDLSVHHEAARLAFFHSPVPDLFDYLRESASRCVRVLAVSLERYSPPPRLAWPLISAGASDVLWWHDQRGAAEEIKSRRWQTIDSALNSDLVRSSMVGGSRAWIALLPKLA